MATFDRFLKITDPLEFIFTVTDTFLENQTSSMRKMQGILQMSEDQLEREN